MRHPDLISAVWLTNDIANLLRGIALYAVAVALGIRVDELGFPPAHASYVELRLGSGIGIIP